jgi:hypothetical protein
MIKMAPKKSPATTPAGLELDSLFEQELRAQNEDLRRAAALSTFYKLHPSNRVTVEQFLTGLKQNKDIWTVVATLGVVDFAEALLGNRTVGGKAPRDARPAKRTRLTDSQKSALKAAIVTVLGSNKDGLNRNDIARAISAEQLSAIGIDRAELANKLRQPLAELVGDSKIHTVGEKRLMKYLAGNASRKK